MTTREFLLNSLYEERLKPVGERNGWKTAIYYYPNACIHIYNDLPVASEDVFYLVKEKKIEYVGLRNHQGQLMPCYMLV